MVGYVPGGAVDFTARLVAQKLSESLGQQVVGFGAYTLWRKTLYAEVSAYRTADRAFSLIRAGHDHDEASVIKGLNPYWRLALNHEWGAHSLMVGTSGMTARIYDDPLNTGDPSTQEQAASAYRRALELDPSLAAALNEGVLAAAAYFQLTAGRV